MQVDPRFAAFVAVASLFTIVPGPDMALVTVTALRSRRSGTLAGLGCASSVLIHANAVWLSLCAWAVARAGGTLGRPAVRRRLEQLTGAVLIALAVRIATVTVRDGA